MFVASSASARLKTVGRLGHPFRLIESRPEAVREILLGGGGDADNWFIYGSGERGSSGEEAGKKKTYRYSVLRSVLGCDSLQGVCIT